MTFRLCAAAVVAMISASGVLAQDAGKPSAERGALAVRGRPAMNPPSWSARAFSDVWKQWGLTEKPTDFDRRVRERYGLHAAPYENAGLPMGLHYSQGLFGKGIMNDCLICHAGVVAGQTIIGLGNSSLDLQTMFDDFAAQDNLPFKVPVQLSYARGTVDPVNPVTFLMTFRDLDLNLTGNRFQLDYSKDVASDPPAWWLLKRKTTRNWTGGVNVNATRLDMVNLLTPLNSPQAIKKHETTFADIHAFVMDIESPRYPFAIDATLAEKGRELFSETCARCHGSYGPGGKYPNKVVPLDTVGTDATLARSLTRKNMEIFNQTWFAQEKGADGGWYKVAETPGYQAPPLDGVWATAPYFHNASVPTIYHVLNSKARPKIFTRSYRSEKEDYDTERLGWKVTVLDRPPDPKLPAHERRKVYDTSLPGRGNTGHTFGDELTEDQRRAVIEYLKTL
jgi:mono/diheme cytochrome c family protein